MKPVSFLPSSWRKKGHKIPHSDEGIYLPKRKAEPLEISLSSPDVRSRTISATPVDQHLSLTPNLQTFQYSRRPSTAPENSVQPQPQRTRTEGAFHIAVDAAYSGHGAPCNAVHGPPHNTIHGPPNFHFQHSPSLISLSQSSDSSSPAPRRPPRPPSLNLDAPIRSGPISGSSRTPPTSPNHVKFIIPTHKGSSYRESTPRHLLRSKRSMPELDGTFQAFSHDHDGKHTVVPEDQVSGSSQPRRPGRDDQPSIDVTEHSGGLSPLSEARRAYTTLDPSTSRKARGFYQTTSSTPHLPLLKANSPVVASTSRIRGSPTSGTSIHHLDGGPDPTLSLFPAPPPLFLRKRPQPLILRPTPTIAPLPPSPLVSSPDFSPLVTPTGLPPPYSPQNSVSQKMAPISKPSFRRAKAHHTLPIHSPPTSPLPSTPPLPDYTISPTQKFTPNNTTRPLRIAHSMSHFRVDVVQPGSATHRITSSDSTSESSRSSDSVRRRMLSRPDVGAVATQQTSVVSYPVTFPGSL